MKQVYGNAAGTDVRLGTAEGFGRRRPAPGHPMP